MSSNAGKKVYRVDEEGFLINRENWDVPFAQWVASKDDITLNETNFSVILYFREYFYQNMKHPDMDTIAQSLGNQLGDRCGKRKDYQDLLHELFPCPHNPVSEICKLAGLPKPAEDNYHGSGRR